MIAELQSRAESGPVVAVPTWVAGVIVLLAFLAWAVSAWQKGRDSQAHRDARFARRHPVVRR